MAEIASLVVRVTGDGIKDTTKELDLLGGASKMVEGWVTKLAAAFAAYKLFEVAKDAALLATRYESLGSVMTVAGNNVGKTSAEMAQLQKQLMATGISAIESRNTLTSMATAQMDLSRATDLARIAQNLARVANINSSEAFQRLVYGLKSGQVEILRTLGLNVNYENSYKELSKTLKKSATSLSENEKMTARTSAVIREAARYNGIYEESLETVNGKLLSMNRHQQNLEVKFGSMFSGVVEVVVTELSEGVRKLSEYFDAHKVSTDVTKENLKASAQYVADMLKVFTNAAGDASSITNDLTLWEILVGGFRLTLGFVKDLFFAILGILKLIMGLLEAALFGLMHGITWLFGKILGFKPPEWMLQWAKGGISNVKTGWNAMGFESTREFYSGGNDLADFMKKNSADADKSLAAENQRIKAAKEAAEAAKKANKETNEHLKEQMKLVDGLRKQYEDLGKSEYDVMVAEINRAKLNPTLRETAKDLALKIQMKKSELALNQKLLENEIELINLQAKSNSAAADLATEKQLEALISSTEEQLQYAQQLTAKYSLNAINKERDLTKLALQRGSISMEQYLMNMKELEQAEMEMRANSGDVWAGMGLVIQDFAQDASNYLADWMSGTKGDFKDLINTMIKELQRYIIYQTMMKPFFDWLGKSIGSTSSSGSSFWGSLFSSAASSMTGSASGRSVQEGQALFVGESGPEAFIAPANGEIISNKNLGNKVNVQVNVTVSSGKVSADVTADEQLGKEVGRGLKNKVLEWVAEANLPGGPLAQRR